MTFAQRYPISPSALAVAMVLVACAFFAGASLVAKVLAISSAEAALHPLQLAFGRFLAGTLMLTPILAWKGKRAITSAVPALYLVRSGCSVGAISCIFAAVASLPLADVTALNYASPFFTLILARLVLKEAVNRARWVAVAIGFCGVVFIANPSGSTLHPMTLIALLSAVFMAGELISLRFIAQRDPTTTTLFMTNLVGLLICAVLAPFVWVEPTATQWALMGLVGAITVTGQVFFIRAIGMVDVSLIAPIFYSTLIYAAIYGFLVFDEIPTYSTLLGAALIVGSGWYLGHAERRIGQ